MICKKIPGALFVVALVCSSSSFAHQVELDTEDAHIIVTRPIDSWSPDTTTSRDTLKALADHQAGFEIYTSPNSGYRGFPTFFQGVQDVPLVQGIEKEALAKGLKLAQVSILSIKSPETVPVGEFPKFAEAQRETFRRLVINQGDPALLEASTDRKKVAGFLLSLATVGLMANQYGALSGSGNALSSGVAYEPYRLSTLARAAVAPILVGGVDLSSSKQIDVRNVTTKDRIGQIIIAYKSEKTEAAEMTALIKAVTALLGADTDPEQVQRARAEDLAMRKAIWTECVEAQRAECQSDKTQTK